MNPTPRHSNYDLLKPLREWLAQHNRIRWVVRRLIWPEKLIHFHCWLCAMRIGLIAGVVLRFEDRKYLTSNPFLNHYWSWTSALIGLYLLGMLAVSLALLVQLQRRELRRKADDPESDITVGVGLMVTAVVADLLLVAGAYTLTLDPRSDVHLGFFIPLVGITLVGRLFPFWLTAVAVLVAQMLVMEAQARLWDRAYASLPPRPAAHAGAWRPTGRLPMQRPPPRDERRVIVLPRLLFWSMILFPLHWLVHRTAQHFRNKNFLNLLVKELPQVVWRKDKDCRFTFVSPNLAKSLGIDVSDMIGKTDEELKFPAHAKYRVDDIRVRWGGETVVCSEPHYHPDRYAEGHKVRTVKQPIRDQRGNIVGIQGVTWDWVPDQDGVQLRDILENSPLSIFCKDRERRFTYANPAFCRSLGRPLLAVLGKRDEDYFKEELVKGYREADVAVLRGKARDTRDEEYDFPEPKGRRRIHTEKVAIRSRINNQVQGVLGTFWDVADVRQERERLLKWFLHDASKPLRTLNKGQVPKLKKLSEELVAEMDDVRNLLGETYGDYPGRLARTCAAIQNRLDKMEVGTRFILAQFTAFASLGYDWTKDAGALAKLGAVAGTDPFHPQPEWVALQEFFERLTGIVGMEYQAHKIEVRVEPEGMQVEHSPDLLMGPFWCLLENALKSSQKHSEHAGIPATELSVVVLWKVQDGWLSMAVSDRGVGIPRDKIAAVQAGECKDEDSTGFGLQIVRHYAELLEGVLEVQSEGPGCGATFTFKCRLHTSPKYPEPTA